MPDDDERSILERMIREMRGKSEQVSGAKRPSEGSPSGVYTYIHSQGAWVRVGETDGWGPKEDGLHIVFTDVAGKCLLCTALGRDWYEFAEALYERIRTHVKLLDEYEEDAYTVLAVCVEGGEVVYSRRFSGVLSLPELVRITAELVTRCPSASRKDISKLKEICPCA